jgi:hypothetical protein
MMISIKEGNKLISALKGKVIRHYGQLSLPLPPPSNWAIGTIGNPSMSKGAMRWFLNVYTEDARGTEY